MSNTGLLKGAVAAIVLVLLLPSNALAQDSARAQAQAWVEKGLAIGGNSAQEAECYRKALELDPAYAAAHFNLGYVHQSQGKLAEALEAYRACVRYDPERAEAHLNMGTIMAVPGATEDLEGARAALCRYVEQAADKPEAAQAKSGVLLIEKRIALLKEVAIQEHYGKEEIETRLSSGFKRGASPYAGPRLPVRIQFEYNSAEILTESESQLAELAAALKGDRLKEVVVLIEGHADSAGSMAYNDDLSRRRAESVKQHLVSRHGILAARFRVEGKGERAPIKPNDTKANQAANRRVEFVNWQALEAIREAVRTNARRSASSMDQFFR